MHEGGDFPRSRLRLFRFVTFFCRLFHVRLIRSRVNRTELQTMDTEKHGLAGADRGGGEVPRVSFPGALGFHAAKREEDGRETEKDAPALPDQRPAVPYQVPRAGRWRVCDRDEGVPERLVLDGRVSQGCAATFAGPPTVGYLGIEGVLRQGIPDGAQNDR